MTTTAAVRIIRANITQYHHSPTDASSIPNLLLGFDRTTGKRPDHVLLRVGQEQGHHVPVLLVVADDLHQDSQQLLEVDTHELLSRLHVVNSHQLRFHQHNLHSQNNTPPNIATVLLLAACGP